MNQDNDKFTKAGKSPEKVPPELLNIQNFITEKQVVISRSNTALVYKDLIPMELKLNNTIYTIYVEDEYNDLAYNNKLLNFILVFMELANINDSTDFLTWCNLHSKNPKNYLLLNYYKDICSKLENICNLFRDGNINYYVTDLDFQLNSGAVQYLRLNKYIE